MAYVFRMECANDPLVGNVHKGPWRGGNEKASWALPEDFHSLYLSGEFFNTPQDYDIVLTPYDVCAVDSYELLNRWFPHRYRRREEYRVVKYYVPERYLIRLPDQVVVDARHLRQVAVTELYAK